METLVGGSGEETDAGEGAISSLQWVQYQLDNYATVKEVLSHARDFQILKLLVTVHYFVCDASGACGVVELDAGTLKTYANASLPVPVMTNDPYPVEQEEIKKYKGYGGDESVDTTPPAPRVVLLAEWLLSPLPKESIVDAFFSALDLVKWNLTRWQIVYRLEKEKKSLISYRTPQHATPKAIHLDALDFPCALPVRFSVIDQEGNKGEPVWKPLTAAENAEVVRRATKALRLLLPHGLASRVAAYPQSLQCSK